MKAPYRSEAEIYPEVADWLRQFLSQKHPTAQVLVLTTPHQHLSRVIAQHGLGDSLPPEWQSWDIKVDIVGFVQHSAQAEIALVECKLAEISLSHLSQAIGYSKVVIPRWSLLISPKGVKQSLRRLLSAYNRQDILVYTDTSGRTKRQIILARWDYNAKRIDWHSVIPSGIL